MAARKALVIGCNAYPGGNALRGCVNDAMYMRQVLTAYGYSVTMLLDSQATAANILDAWKGLLADARSGDRFAVTYSGHGTQVRDVHGDEPDGMDEAICPVDFDWGNPATWIIDDTIAQLVKDAHLPYDAGLTVVFDSCHAGTALRVPGNPTTRVRTIAMPPRMQAPPVAWWRSLPWPIGGFTYRSIGEKTAKVGPYVVLLAMTTARQLAADAFIDGDFHGAGTYALQMALETLPNAPLRVLRREMVRWLWQHGYGGPNGQKPTLYGSHVLQRNAIFS